MRKGALPTIAICLPLVLADCAASRLPRDAARNIDSVMSLVARRDQFAGAVLVVDKGTLVYQNAFGYSDLASGRKLTLDTMIELASLTKQFTAMGIMILKERSALGYDDDIRKYFPSLPYQGVTVRHLLNHTSGLPDFKSLFDEKWDHLKIAVNRDVLTLLETYRPPAAFPPGADWAYSNTGYVLLASIIENISGKTYQEFLKENIFDKLQMTRTRVITRRLVPGNVDDAAFGCVYSFEKGGYVPPESEDAFGRVFYLDGVVGAGRLYSTIRDLFKWDRALASGRLIGTDALNEAFLPGKRNDGSEVGYGFGWLVGRDKNRRMLSHTGSYPGYSHIYVRFPDVDRSIIVLTIHEPQAPLWKALDEILDGDRRGAPPKRAALEIKQNLDRKNPGKIRGTIEAMLKNRIRFDFDRESLEGLGFDLLDNARAEEAAEVFRCVLAVFPASAEAREGLAEAGLQRNKEK